MITLYIDTHTAVIVLALYKDEVLMDLEMSEEQRDHSQKCMPMLIQFLEKNQVSVHEVSDIVVVNGPGSFTGVRLGVTIAKTLSYTLGIPIRSITSLERFLPLDTPSKVISISEKNGYFIGVLNDKFETIITYDYVKKSENKEIGLLLDESKVDYQKLITSAHQKEASNPHQVNPFYVKKIEVEK